MERKAKLILCILLSIAPLIYLSTVWAELPDIVATHFNAAGKPNGYSSKNMLWVLGGFMSLTTISVFLLLNNLNRIDPKRYGEAPSPSFARLADGLALILSVINFIALFACTGHPVVATKMVFPIIGLLFAFLGNMMYSLKPNYFAGIRLPWTLASDNNWKATHRIAGITWFAGGVLFMICALTMQAKIISVLLLLLTALMIGIPVVYSFLYFKRHSAINKP
jgi:uncharacterized membrane protein